MNIWGIVFFEALKKGYNVQDACMQAEAKVKKEYNSYAYSTIGTSYIAGSKTQKFN